MPYASSYVPQKLVEEFSAAWNVFNADFYYFLVAAWVHTLMTDESFTLIDATALRRMVKLDLHHIASRPGGQAALYKFYKTRKATTVFSWTIVLKDVIQRDTQTRAARQVKFPLGIDDRVRLYAKVSLSGFGVVLLQGRGHGRRWRISGGGGAGERRVCPSRDSIGR